MMLTKDLIKQLTQFVHLTNGNNESLKNMTLNKSTESETNYNVNEFNKSEDFDVDRVKLENKGGSPLIRIEENEFERFIDALKENKNVKSLTFCNFILSERVVANVIGLMKINFVIHELVFEDCALDDTSIFELIKSVSENKFIHKFYMNSVSSINEFDANALKIAPQLKALQLEYMNITDSDATVIADMLKENSTLTLLNLKGNDIGNDGLKEISDSLMSNNVLQKLNMAENQYIDSEGAIYIAQALKTNSTLEELDLGGIDFGESIEIFEALKMNSSLHCLRLEKSPVYLESCFVLAELIRENLTLYELDLSGCYLDSGCCFELFDALRENRCIKFLWVEVQTIDLELCDFLKQNTSICELHMSCETDMLFEQWESWQLQDKKIFFSQIQFETEEELLKILQSNVTSFETYSVSPDLIEWEVEKVLKIPGNLILRHCSFIRLPSSLIVEGSLWIEHCENLVELPNKLDVHGDFYLRNCNLLEKFVDEVLELNGSLTIKDCENLVSLPSVTKVANKLEISNCCSVTHLPKTLLVNGKVELKKCNSLRKIDQNFGGKLEILHCSSLECVGESTAKLEFDFLRIVSCCALKQLPQTLQVNNDLELLNLDSLVNICEHLNVGGDCLIKNCVLLNHLPPRNFKVNGDVGIFGCHSLVSIPSDLWFKSVQIGNCSSLSSLPRKLMVANDLTVYSCCQLRTIPNDLNVLGDIEIRQCDLLSSLPLDLKINADLLIDECAELLSLPENLTVGGRLIVTECRSLARLPNGLVFSKLCDFSGCTSLSSFPSDIENWGGESSKEIILTNTGFATEQLDYLRNMNINGLSFFVDRENDFDYENLMFDSLKEATLFWFEITECEIQSNVVNEIEDIVPPIYQHGLLVFLSKLKQAKEFTLEDCKKALAKRVVEIVLKQLPNEEIFIRICDSIDACSDKPIWALNQMTAVVKISQARGNREQLEKVGKQLLKLNIVHKHVREKIKSLNWVDDVCVYLKYEIELRDCLDLPVSALAMIFPNYITITDEDLEKAKQQALSITEDDFHEFLNNWNEWKRQERFEFAQTIKWENLDQIILPSQQVSPSSDPVVLDGECFSLAHVLDHWVKTGMDLHNNQILCNRKIKSMKKVISKEK